MSKFLDYDKPYKESGLYRFIEAVDKRFLKKDETLVTGPTISKTRSSNSTIEVMKGTYTIVENITNGLKIYVRENATAYDIRTFIQFQTGNDISSGLSFGSKISRSTMKDFIIEPNSTYVIRLIPDSINNGFLMDWYKIK